VKQILRKINGIVNDIEQGWMTEDDALDFFRGYLIAMEDIGVIDIIERGYFMDFLSKLIHNRIFTQKEGD
jgi:hypothetical protein